MDTFTKTTLQFDIGLCVTYWVGHSTLYMYISIVAQISLMSVLSKNLGAEWSFSFLENKILGSIYSWNNLRITSLSISSHCITVDVPGPTWESSEFTT